MTESEWLAISLSIKVAMAATLVSLPLAIATGWVLARKDFPGKSLVEVAVNLPLVLPPVVTGFMLLILFGRNGILGAWFANTFGIEFAFDWKGAVIAAAVVAFPLVVRPIRIGFQNIDPKLEFAARTLGAGPIDTFRSISLPLAAPAIISGMVLGFARGLGEFGATLMIAGNIAGATQTIPLLVYENFESPGGIQSSYRIILVSILIATVAIFVSEKMEQRSRRGGKQ